MHLIWENLLPNLIKLWTGKFKDLDHADEPYVLTPTVWEAIGTASAAAGSTMPSAFGSRVPNPADGSIKLTAETTALWTLYIAPTLLLNRFKNAKFYKHFVLLVKLLNLCMQFEITDSQIDELRKGFRDWVVEYEILYYRHDPARLALCPLTIHALLHIADSIAAIGPVWTAWAFPMERYCGQLLRGIRSRRFPYASLDNYILERSQLKHIKLLYDLYEELRLRAPATGIGHVLLPEYPLFVFMPPQSRHERLPNEIHTKIIAWLVEEFGVRPSTAQKLVRTARFTQYGKVRRLEGGDTISASNLVRRQEDGRDATFVRYDRFVDKNARFKNKPVEMERRDKFGQLLRVVIVPITAEMDVHLHVDGGPRTYALAVIRSVKIEKRHSLGMSYYSQMGPVDVVDLDAVRFVVGRVYDPSQRLWAIVDRSDILTSTQVQ
ncbi:uncharacterized protein C8Q71DRAFT_799969 [Rhodofomes roseus]|uniref:Transposase n=1 Tax=Rhodofomes roseus TaxID=34475 RepID=A0ABQ8JX38_9APHY|nr:uncharacterized protein C8Q71DRAFT_799969 [Rhodofomes roseus]KAH9828627.1 hypothetical protein C8Q71DRAFT_799969 [Rhodofomes roseus]